MKTFVGIFLLMWAAAVHAAPRLDVAAGSEEPIISTIVPDHQDPNLYYFFPTSFRIAQAGGKMQFTYYETKNFLGVSGAYAVMTMTANFGGQSLDEKVADIKAHNPNARFTTVPVISSTISQMLSLPSPTLEDVKCQSQGNMLGQEIGCEIVVKVSAREVFIKAIRRNLTNVLSLTYTFAGIVNGQPREVTHGLPIVFADVGSGNYFFDGNGNPILDEVMEEYKKMLAKRDKYVQEHALEVCLVETTPSQDCKKKLSDSKWLKIVKRIEELKKELGIKN